MAQSKLLLYFMRHDLRIHDNPIFHHLSNTPDHGFTHFIPIYVFSANQIEISGFLKSDQESPYPPAVSEVGKFWRCGPHRAKFIAQTIWELQQSLESLDSGLLLRFGASNDVLQHLIAGLKEQGLKVDAVWMTKEESFEEKQEEDSLSHVCSENYIEFKLWTDEKYFIDDRDTGLEDPRNLPDVFTEYRKTQEPLRERPRSSLPRPEAGTLPPPLASTLIPDQSPPFVVPEGYQGLEARLLEPLGNILPDAPPFPPDAQSAHPFAGGESHGFDRLVHLVKNGAMTTYKATRNGLVGLDFSTKLSAYLSFGCMTARQIHEELLKFEDGLDPNYEHAPEYGEGENEGTNGIRFELLWRDYMRLCTMKFGLRLFSLSGFRNYDGNYDKEWKTPDEGKARPEQDPSPEEIQKIFQRFKEGTTGMGLIDASQRELYHTGYTSNRARQNVASFLAKHLNIDWRFGAEWYEMLLIDYDVSSNWANWQYVAGVGNDPRGDARIFNPVKQAFDYDTDGVYVRSWVPELKVLEKAENVFQAWTTESEDLEKYGLTGNIMVTNPVKKIDFSRDHKPRNSRRPYRLRFRRSGRRRGKGGGGGGGGEGDGDGSDDGSAQSTSTYGGPRDDKRPKDQGEGQGQSSSQSQGQNQSQDQNQDQTQNQNQADPQNPYTPPNQQSYGYYQAQYQAQQAQQGQQGQQGTRDARGRGMGPRGPYRGALRGRANYPWRGRANNAGSPMARGRGASSNTASSAGTVTGARGRGWNGSSWRGNDQNRGNEGFRRGPSGLIWRGNLGRGIDHHPDRAVHYNNNNNNNNNNSNSNSNNPAGGNSSGAGGGTGAGDQHYQVIYVPQPVQPQLQQPMQQPMQHPMQHLVQQPMQQPFQQPVPQQMVQSYMMLAPQPMPMPMPMQQPMQYPQHIWQGQYQSPPQHTAPGPYMHYIPHHQGPTA